MPLLRIYTIFFSNLSALPAILIGWRHRHLFWWYCMLSFASDATNKIFIVLEIKHGLIYNVFLLLEWLLIGTYLIGVLFANRHKNNRNASVAFIAVGFIAWFLYNGYNKVSYSGAVVLYSIYIGLLLACLFKIMHDFEYLELQKSPLFMFCAVFLLFTSGTITLLGIKDYLNVHNPALSSSLWAIQNILNILKNSVLAYCIYLLKKQKKELQLTS